MNAKEKLAQRLRLLKKGKEKGKEKVLKDSTSRSNPSKTRLDGLSISKEGRTTLNPSKSILEASRGVKIGSYRVVEEWESREVRLWGSKRKVLVLGSFWVVPSIDGTIKATLYHVPTGEVAVYNVKDVTTAQLIGEYLWKNFCLAFRCKDLNSLKEKLGSHCKGLHRWTLDCASNGFQPYKK